MVVLPLEDRNSCFVLRVMQPGQVLINIFSLLFNFKSEAGLMKTRRCRVQDMVNRGQ